jgi:hypothetical protein
MTTFTSMEDGIDKYFDDYYSITINGAKSFKGTTLRGWFSVLLKFYQATAKGNLSALLPCVENSFDKWDKVDKPVVQATVLTEENLCK